MTFIGNNTNKEIREKYRFKSEKYNIMQSSTTEKYTQIFGRSSGRMKINYESFKKHLKLQVIE
jgi:hypothetical protein